MEALRPTFLVGTVVVMVMGVVVCGAVGETRGETTSCSDCGVATAFLVGETMTVLKRADRRRVFFVDVFHHKLTPGIAITVRVDGDKEGILLPMTVVHENLKRKEHTLEYEGSAAEQAQIVNFEFTTAGRFFFIFNAEPGFSVHGEEGTATPPWRTLHIQARLHSPYQAAFLTFLVEKIGQRTDHLELAPFQPDGVSYNVLSRLSPEELALTALFLDRSLSKSKGDPTAKMTSAEAVQRVAVTAWLASVLTSDELLVYDARPDIRERFVLAARGRALSLEEKKKTIDEEVEKLRKESGQMEAQQQQEEEKEEKEALPTEGLSSLFKELSQDEQHGGEWGDDHAVEDTSAKNVAIFSSTSLPWTSEDKLDMLYNYDESQYATWEEWGACNVVPVTTTQPVATGGSPKAEEGLEPFPTSTPMATDDRAAHLQALHAALQTSGSTSASASTSTSSPSPSPSSLPPNAIPDMAMPAVNRYVDLIHPQANDDPQIVRHSVPEAEIQAGAPPTTPTTPTSAFSSSSSFSSHNVDLLHPEGRPVKPMLPMSDGPFSPSSRHTDIVGADLMNEDANDRPPSTRAELENGATATQSSSPQGIIGGEFLNDDMPPQNPPGGGASAHTPPFSLGDSFLAIETHLVRACGAVSHPSYPTKQDTNQHDENQGSQEPDKDEQDAEAKVALAEYAEFHKHVLDILQSMEWNLSFDRQDLLRFLKGWRQDADELLEKEAQRRFRATVY